MHRFMAEDIKEGRFVEQEMQDNVRRYAPDKKIEAGSELAYEADIAIERLRNADRYRDRKDAEDEFDDEL